MGRNRDYSMLGTMFERSPSFLAVVRGSSYVFEMANDAYIQLIGQRAILGKPLLDALPEAANQGFIEVLDRVVATGEPFVGKAMPAMVARTQGGPLEEIFVDFVFQVLPNNDGVNDGVLVHGTEVTAHVRARLEGERLLRESRQTQEDLAIAYTELERQQAELETLNQQLQENAVEMDAQAEKLEVTMQDLTERTAAEEAGTRRARFAGAVGEAITSGGELSDVTHRCCQAAVDHLDAAFARVWVLDSAQDMLVLTASAGQYTHLDGPHSRVPVGQLKIGQIAAERRAHLTNAVVGDPRVSEQAWAAREGMVAFAGYPLIVAEKLEGVVALFARRELSTADFEAFETAATAIAVRISNTRLLEGERAARASAEAANESKSDFLSMMSHELRTPLNAISGFAQLLELEVHGPMSHEQRDYLSRMQRAGQHLQALVGDVLEYAHLGAGRVRYALEDVMVEDVLTDAEMLVGADIVARDLTINRVCLDAPAAEARQWRVRADPEKMRQIVINLLNNARKFTTAGGRIDICCALVGKQVEIRVSDTGRGMTHDQLERIFEPFVQIDRASTPIADQGVGLGLAISREFARGMGGDLTVKSTPGSGSTFTLALPAAGVSS